MTTIAMLSIPIDLEGKDIFRVQIREPGIIRAVGFWLKQPKVLGSASMRQTEVMPQPELHVECDPDGAQRMRTFAFMASNHTLPVHEGYALTYVGTAIRANECGHLFEIVEVPGGVHG